MSQEKYGKDGSLTAHGIGNPIFTCDRNIASSVSATIPSPETVEPCSKKQHSMYTTSSSNYGKMQSTTIETKSDNFHGKSQRFTKVWLPKVLDIMASVESKTLIACTVELVGAIKSSPLEIAEELFAIGFIPSNTVEQMRQAGVPGRKASELMSVVRGRVSNTSKRYYDFVKILEKYGWMSDTVMLLEATRRNGGEKVEDESREEGGHHVEENNTITKSKSVLSVVTMECLKLRDGKKIHIAESIGPKYTEFGHILLDDTAGTITGNIAHKHQKDAPAINRDILKTWINGTGKKPVGWETLIEVLDDIGLRGLVDDIKNRE